MCAGIKTTNIYTIICTPAGGQAPTRPQVSSGVCCPACACSPGWPGWLAGLASSEQLWGRSEQLWRSSEQLQRSSQQLRSSSSLSAPTSPSQSPPTTRNTRRGSCPNANPPPSHTHRVEGEPIKPTTPCQFPHPTHHVLSGVYLYIYIYIYNFIYI